MYTTNAWRRGAASRAVYLDWPKSSRECVIFKIAVKDPASKVSAHILRYKAFFTCEYPIQKRQNVRPNS